MVATGVASERVHGAAPVHRIGAEDLRWSLAEGWRDFRAKRGDLLFAGILYPLIGFAAAFFAIGTESLQLLFPFFAGLTLLGPLVATGFYEIARRREQGLESNWNHFFDVLKSPSIGAIAAVGLALFAIFALWVLMASAIYVAFLGPDLPQSLGDMLNRAFTTPEGWGMMLVGNLVGLVFAIVVLAISVVSLPMLVDRKTGAERAVATSIAAVRRNPAMMMRWGLTVAGLLVLGAIPLLIGLAVALPVLGYATWHLYTRTVDRSGG